MLLSSKYADLCWTLLRFPSVLRPSVFCTLQYIEVLRFVSGGTFVAYKDCRQIEQGTDEVR